MIDHELFNPLNYFEKYAIKRTNYSNIIHSEKGDTETFSFTKKLVEAILKTTRVNLHSAMEELKKAERALDSIEISEDTKNKEARTDDDRHSTYSNLLKYIFRVLIKTRNVLNKTSNQLNHEVFLLAEHISTVTDFDSAVKLEEENNQHMKKEYNLSAEKISEDCLLVSFEGLITSRIYEKDVLFYKELQNEVKRCFVKNTFNFKNFNSLFMCVEQETTLGTSTVFVRDFDKSSLGKLINSIVKGTCRSDSALSMNTSLVTYNGEINKTYIYLATPDFYFAEYLKELKEKF